MNCYYLNVHFGRKTREFRDIMIESRQYPKARKVAKALHDQNMTLGRVYDLDYFCYHKEEAAE